MWSNFEPALENAAALGARARAALKAVFFGRFCLCIPPREGIMVLNALVGALSCVGLVLGIVLANRPQGVDSAKSGQNASWFTQVIVWLVGLSGLVSSVVCFDTLWWRRGDRFAHWRVGQFSAGLMVIALLMSLHTFVELVAGNPNFGAKQVVITLLSVVVQSAWAATVFHFARFVVPTWNPNRPALPSSRRNGSGTASGYSPHLLGDDLEPYTADMLTLQGNDHVVHLGDLPPASPEGARQMWINRGGEWKLAGDAGAGTSGGDL